MRLRFPGPPALLPLLLLGARAAAADPIPFPATPRLVVAHFMMGNTFPYTVDDWVQDITLASSKGIDAFALNLGTDPWQLPRLTDAFAAAALFANSTPAPQNPFSLFLSFDMSSLPCSSPPDADRLHAYLMQFTGHARYLLYPPASPETQRPLLSTFAGETCTFGRDTPARGWGDFVHDAANDAGLGNGRGVHFVPGFFVDGDDVTGEGAGSGLERFAEAVDGDFNWNSAWPMGNSSITMDTDYAHLRYLKAKTYMAGVSPWFFTHYPPTSFNKNWLYRSDDHLPVTRWEQIVANRAYVDIAQIISWNDFGESHYVGPLPRGGEGDGGMPGGTGWVRGMEHVGWLELMKYYITAYKTGTYPTIQKDQIILWGRLHPATADDPYDPLAKPTHWDWVEDNIYALVLLSQPAHVSLSCGPSNLSIELPAGASKLALSLSPARLSYLNATDLAACNVTTVVQTLDRATQLAGLAPEGFEWRREYREGEGYNFNAFVVASSGA